MGNRELFILIDYLQLWTRSLVELLDNLAGVSPENGGLLSEINYWRDITRVLDAVSKELKQSYVEMIL